MRHASKPSPFTRTPAEKSKGCSSPCYVLRLYISGTTPNSTRALTNLQRYFKEELAGRYELEVVDIFQRPDLAREARLIAVPTLVKKLPEPVRRIIGALTDKEQVIVDLDLKERVL